MDYGEWKYKKRSEGMISCAQSITSKIGSAVGAGLVGMVMGLSGYVGEASVQSEAANNAIITLNTLLPAFLALLILLLYQFYDLDKLLPKIRKQLKEAETD
jgi:GPH family glycoside/pentoside/hexuronide:cation symporter